MLSTHCFTDHIKILMQLLLSTFFLHVFCLLKCRRLAVFAANSLQWSTYTVFCLYKLSCSALYYKYNLIFSENRVQNCCFFLFKGFLFETTSNPRQSEIEESLDYLFTFGINILFCRCVHHWFQWLRVHLHLSLTINVWSGRLCVCCRTKTVTMNMCRVREEFKEKVDSLAGISLKSWASYSKMFVNLARVSSHA